jgi:hypothetical protein
LSFQQSRDKTAAVRQLHRVKAMEAQLRKLHNLTNSVEAVSENVNMYETVEQTVQVMHAVSSRIKPEKTDAQLNDIDRITAVMDDVKTLTDECGQLTVDVDEESLAAELEEYLRMIDEPGEDPPPAAASEPVLIVESLPSAPREPKETVTVKSIFERQRRAVAA